MRCSECGNDNAPGSEFCSRCGIVFKAVCAACGHSREPGARFCGWCGARQTAARQVAEPQGERKQATVMFADMVGSTELISGLDAELSIGRLQPVVAAMMKAVHRFDGTVLRTLGDGLMAAFGVPTARDGHALLACQAALAMQDAVASLPNPSKIRIGLHSGEVIVGALDTGLFVEQAAQGLTVHIASRVEQAADPGAICLSPQCRALVSAYCDTASVGMRVLKGIPAPVEIFRLIGLKPSVASDQFRDSDLPRLRGRERELEVLQRALLDAEKGIGCAIGIAAPPGVGRVACATSSANGAASGRSMFWKREPRSSARPRRCCRSSKCCAGISVSCRHWNRRRHVKRSRKSCAPSTRRSPPTSRCWRISLACPHRNWMVSRWTRGARHSASARSRAAHRQVRRTLGVGDHLRGPALAGRA